MERIFKKIDHSAIIFNTARANLKIGEDLTLIDKYTLDPEDSFKYTANNNTFVEVLDGYGEIIINSVKYTVKAPCIIGLLSGNSIESNIKSNNALQRNIVLSDRLLGELRLNLLKLNDIRTTIIENPVIELTPDAMAAIEIYTDALRGIAIRPDRGNNLDCAKFVTLALLYGPLFDIFKRRTDAETFRSPSISSKFFDLIQEHVKDEHRLIYYANELNISERYLYITVKTATGKSPGYWIDYYLISEAKRLLADIELSIQQIVEALNFSSAPAFAKFFRRMENICPLEFRRKISSNG